MVIGIDASNIRQGGGVTHLLEILRNYDESAHEVEKIIVWAPNYTLERLPKLKCLVVQEQKLLDGNILSRTFWQTFVLSKVVKEHKIDVLFSLCNNVVNGCKTVLICHSHLPLERKEINRYPLGLARVRLELLRKKFISSYRKATGIIFLTDASKSLVNSLVDLGNKEVIVIPHGFNQSLFEPGSKPLSQTVKLLYVSPLEPYKHQHKVVEAVKMLIEEGNKIELHLIGRRFAIETAKVKEMITLSPGLKDVIFLHGNIPYEELNKYYQEADIFVYASTCESFGIILLEAMACKLPIASSDIMSLKETLQDGGIYFDAENTNSIKNSLKLYLENKHLQIEKGSKAFTYSKMYSWKVCAMNTFKFLESI